MMYTSISTINTYLCGAAVLPQIKESVVCVAKCLEKILVGIGSNVLY